MADVRNVTWLYVWNQGPRMATDACQPGFHVGSERPTATRLLLARLPCLFLVLMLSQTVCDAPDRVVTYGDDASPAKKRTNAQSFHQGSDLLSTQPNKTPKTPLLYCLL